MGRKLKKKLCQIFGKFSLKFEDPKNATSTFFKEKILDKLNKFTNNLYENGKKWF